MPAGSPLVAGSYGSGRIRSSKDLRRIAAIFASALEPGDPIAYSPHYFLEPYEELGGQPTNVLLVPTAGDTIVPFSTGIAQARAAGIIDQETIDPRYGMTVDQWMVDRRVIQGIEQYGPWLDIDGNPCLFDADDFDNGMDGTEAPSEAPLRLTVETEAGVSGLRIPYIETTGTHGFAFPEPDRPFDQNAFALNMLAYYIYADGQEIVEDVCMEDFSCDWLPELDINSESEDPEPEDPEPEEDSEQDSEEDFEETQDNSEDEGQDSSQDTGNTDGGEE